MARVRVQMAPEVELKMDIAVPEVDTDTRDYDVQQHKAQIYAEFERRLAAAFPEGYKVHSFEFGLDRGWHEDLGEG